MANNKYKEYDDLRDENERLRKEIKDMQDAKTREYEEMRKVVQNQSRPIILGDGSVIDNVVVQQLMNNPAGAVYVARRGNTSTVISAQQKAVVDHIREPKEAKEKQDRAAKELMAIFETTRNGPNIFEEAMKKQMLIDPALELVMPREYVIDPRTGEPFLGGGEPPVCLTAPKIINVIKNGNIESVASWETFSFDAKPDDPSTVPPTEQRIFKRMQFAPETENPTGRRGAILAAGEDYLKMQAYLSTHGKSETLSRVINSLFNTKITLSKARANLSFLVKEKVIPAFDLLKILRKEGVTDNDLKELQFIELLD